MHKLRYRRVNASPIYRLQMKTLVAALIAFLVLFTGSVPAFSQYALTTIAGDGPEGIPAARASLNQPSRLTWKNGALYIADAGRWR